MAKGVNFTFRATNAAKGAMRDFDRGLRGIQEQTRRTQALQRSWNRGLNANRRAVQQVGFQLSDFAIQISGGQSAMLAFVQQGGQVLQFFGAFGAVAAALLAVFGSLAIAFVKSGKSLSDLTPLAGVLREEFRGLGVILGHVKELMIDFANVVVNNLDVILIAVSIVAGYFATKWVASVVRAAVTTGALSNVLRATALSYYAAGTGAAAATLATSAWTGALALLRVALIRLGIPALVIGLAYLIERFMALSQAAGGFGEALSLLKDVAVEVFDRIRLAFALVPLAVQLGSNQMRGFFVDALADMAERFVGFTTDVANGLNSLFGTNLKPIGSEFAKGLRDAADASSEAGASIREEMAGIAGSVTAPLTSLQKIRDMIKESKVDVRDWFGGAAKDAKKGGKEIETVFENMTKTISRSMMSAFKGLLDGTKSFAEATRDILGSIIDKIIDILMTPIFNSIAGSIAGGILGGLGIAGSTPMPSFEGGGFTGAGARAGGLDGKGGRLAMVHPDETVVDHTKGQSTGGNTVNFYIQTPDVEGFRRSQRQLARQAKAALG